MTEKTFDTVVTDKHGRPLEAKVKEPIGVRIGQKISNLGERLQEKSADGTIKKWGKRAAIGIGTVGGVALGAKIWSGRNSDDEDMIEVLESTTPAEDPFEPDSYEVKVTFEGGGDTENDEE